MMYKPVFTEHSQLDFNDLDGSQKIQILKSLTKIEKNGMNTEQPLSGNLWDCRKLKHKRLWQICQGEVLHIAGASFLLYVLSKIS